MGRRPSCSSPSARNDVGTASAGGFDFRCAVESLSALAPPDLLTDLREDDQDLSFAEFGDSGRLYPSPTKSADLSDEANPAESLVGRQGLEPWTLGLKARCSTN